MKMSVRDGTLSRRAGATGLKGDKGDNGDKGDTGATGPAGTGMGTTWANIDRPEWTNQCSWANVGVTATYQYRTYRTPYILQFIKCTD